MQHSTIGFRVSWLALCATVGASACSGPRVQAGSAPVIQGGAAPVVQSGSAMNVPGLPNGTLTSGNTRQLGTFASVSAAIAAARGANLGAGIYGLADVPDGQVAISAEGNVFAVSPVIGGGTSGAPPRDSKDPR